jgi:hypothetical protein
MPQDVSIHKLLRLIVPTKRDKPTDEEQAVLDKFRELWPEDRIAELLGDFLRKPNCGGCIDRLVMKISSDGWKIQELVNLVDPTGEKTKPIKGGVRRPAPVRGLIRDIEDSEGAFQELLDEMYKRGVRFSIAVRALDEGRIRVYFY